MESEKLVSADGLREWLKKIPLHCVYRCGCPEMQTCGMYEWWLKFHPDIASTDIQKRYNTYNELFWKVRAKRGNDTGD